MMWPAIFADSANGNRIGFSGLLRPVFLEAVAAKDLQLWAEDRLVGGEALFVRAEDPPSASQAEGKTTVTLCGLLAIRRTLIQIATGPGIPQIGPISALLSLETHYKREQHVGNC